MQFLGRMMLTASVLVVACSDDSERDGAADAGMVDADVVAEPDAGTALDAAAEPDAAPESDAGTMLSVPDATYLDELTSEQATALCTWMVDIQGGPHTIDCDDGTQITINPVADCLENVWPHCQVGLLRPCVEAQAEDQCGSAPAACTTFYECAGGF